MADILATHRVIGIRHTLKQLKDAGLVERESMYPNEAIGDVRDFISKCATDWYQIGARRGAREVLDLILDGKLRVEKRGRKYEIIAHVNNIEWETKLKISVGTKRRIVASKKYRVKVSELDFK